MIEIVLLIIAYTTVSISIVFGLICYARNIESKETIAFMLSLLILIIAFTVSAIWNESDQGLLFLLLAMILVGVTTVLDVMEERQHDLSSNWKNLLMVAGAFLFLLTLLTFFFDDLAKVEYLVGAFLGFSVVGAMLIIRTTKPHPKIKHLERAERMFSLGFLILVPLSLYFSFISKDTQNLGVGYALPLIFILLAGFKIWDDLKRLSILKRESDVRIQDLKNYALTKREAEITNLLTKGYTYKQIAEELFISMPTVKTHTSKIYKKCSVKNKSELILLLHR